MTSMDSSMGRPERPSQFGPQALTLPPTPAASDAVEIPLGNFTFTGTSQINAVRLTGLDPATMMANQVLLSDQDARTKIKVGDTRSNIIDPTEILERIVHCRTIGGKAYDSAGNEITEPEKFVADYARGLLEQLKELGVFNVAKHCVFDITTRRATYHDGFRPTFEDVTAKERLVWMDLVLSRQFKHLHSATTGYFLQRICAAALYQKPKSALQISSNNSRRALAVAKLPFPAVKEGRIEIPEAHIAVGDGVILTVRSSRVERIDNELHQFFVGNVTTSGCILEYLITRSGEGMKNARDLFWSEIRKIEGMQQDPKVDAKTTLARIALVEDVASNLLRTAQRVAQRLELETNTIEELYPDSNFAKKWFANWSASIQGLDGILERLKQERAQVETVIEEGLQRKNDKQAETSRRTTNLLTVVLGAATIIQSLSFIVEGGSISVPRIGVSLGVFAGVAGLFWRSLNHQAKITNSNGNNN